MTRRIRRWGFVAALSLAALVAVAIAPLAMAQAPDARRHWQYSAPIEVPATDAARLVAVAVPAGVTRRAREHWADLRVIDASGRDVPFVLDPGRAVRTVSWRVARLLEPSVAEGGYSQVVLDIGPAPRTHNAIRLDVERDRDFLTWVEIAVGDDGRSWRVVRERAPFFDLSDQDMGTTRKVTYPDSPARYVRIRLLDATRRYRVRGAEVAEEAHEPPAYQPAGIDLVPVAAPPQRTAWTSPATGDQPRVSVAAVRFETRAPAFFRPVVVQVSDDGREWRRVASGDVFRARQTGSMPESLDVEIPETWARHWRVTVFDRDEAPIGDLKPALLMVPRRVVFEQASGGVYRLIYGNPRADPPEYFLGRLIDRAALDAAMPATLGAERVNPDYADPAPWTERHPVVLWIALAVAVLVLGGLAMRSLKRST